MINVQVEFALRWTQGKATPMLGADRSSQGADGEAVAYLCATCGTQYPPAAQPPARCPICEDDRQYVGPDGQRWTTLAELRGHYHNRFEPMEAGVTKIVTEPAFAIGQQAYLVETDSGTLL